MKGYIVFSVGLHSLAIVGVVTAGTLLSQPRMSYYGVDLFSLPSGPASGGPAVTPGPVAKPVEETPIEEDETPAPKEVIRVRGKVTKKPPTRTKIKKPLTHAKPVKPSWAEGFNNDAPAQNQGSSGGMAAGGGGGGSGSGIVAEAGPAFPYPWYLKTIADRLDKQWQPPREFDSDTMCQVSFVIHRNGEITGSQLSKASGDNVFDQLALRAVLYSNPLPPLPNGFPDETLKVHMKFVGKR